MCNLIKFNRKVEHKAEYDAYQLAKSEKRKAEKQKAEEEATKVKQAKIEMSPRNSDKLPWRKTSESTFK